MADAYDRILLDCPPVFGVSDPLVLLPHAHGVIFVARFNKSRRRNLAHALQKLREGTTPILGAVLNGVSLHKPGYSYYYARRYGDTYSHYRQKKGTKER